MQFKTKILAAFLLVSLSTLLVISIFSYTISEGALEKAQFDKLASVRELRTSEIERYFENILNQAETFSKNGTTSLAIKEFKDAFNTLPEDLKKLGDGPSVWEKSLNEYYTNEFMPRLS